MIVIFFLCIKLCILHLCVSDLGYQCKRDDSSTKPTIFLIEDYSYLNLLLNNRFQYHCQYIYEISTVSQKEANKYDNVIQFAVPDYYDGKLPKNFVYAGNISDTDEAVCNKTGKTEPEFDCHEIANLVNSSILKINDGDIYYFVQKMKIDKHRESCNPFIERKTFNLTTVVLCVDWIVSYKGLKVNIQPLKLVVTNNCYNYLNYYKYTDRYLAVLTPKPFELFYEFSVPTIFYETPYMFSEKKTAFPNSMNVVPWRLLKYGFLMFIQTVGWQRVVIVIVTDDSEYSLEFENELIALFNTERIVYTVIRCEDANCEMDKIKQELYRVSAKIVIANVEEEHAQYLYENVHQITWIVRDMAANRKKKNLDYHLNVFSIYLRAVNKTKGCNVDDNILTGLSSISLAYKNIANEDYAVNNNEFYRRFAVKINEITTRKPEAIIVVNRLTTNSAYDDEEISTMYVDRSGAQLLTFKDPFKSGKPSDGTTHCLVTSYDYFIPCGDTLVMLLMLVLLLFVITFILIICYFDNTSPYNDSRYQNL